MLLELPSQSEWIELMRAYPYDQVQVAECDFRYFLNPPGSMECFTASHQIFTWTVHLQNRISQTRWSHGLMSYFYNKGIPDDEWFLSPGRQGQSIEFLPHFSKRDHSVKMMFDYYADIFYYKLFSCWDNVGHLLNLQYDLELNRPDFHKAIDKLQQANNPLWLRLQPIRDSSDFQLMKELRHDVTHNELPGHIGSGIKKYPDGFSFGGGDYTPSKAIRDNAIASLDLFKTAISEIRKSTED